MDVYVVLERYGDEVSPEASRVYDQCGGWGIWYEKLEVR